MHRCFVSPDAWSPSGARLSADETHHLAHVLRLGCGADVEVFDGTGREAVGTVVDIGREALVSDLRDERHLERDVHLSLILALPKGQRMDWIVEKAAELGVATIWPVISERVVARPSPKQLDSKRQRWQRIAVSGAKQCGSPWVPDIRPIMPLNDALQTAVPGLDALFAGVIGENAEPMRDAVQRIQTHPMEGETPSSRTGEGSSRTPHVGLLIGPEGDLAEAEVKAVLDAGATGVSFGTRILRVDTAALYGLSVLVYELTARAGGEG